MKKRILSFLLALALLIPMVPQLALPASAESYEIVTADSSLYPESNHNYANNLYETKTFSYPGAEKLSVTFSTKTYVSDLGVVLITFIYMMAMAY